MTPFDGLLYLEDDFTGDPIPFTDMRLEWAPCSAGPLPYPVEPGPLSYEVTYTMRRQAMRQIARAFGIPSHLLGGPSRPKLRRGRTSRERKAEEKTKVAE